MRKTQYRARIVFDDGRRADFTPHPTNGQGWSTSHEALIMGWQLAEQTLGRSNVSPSNLTAARLDQSFTPPPFDGYRIVVEQRTVTFSRWRRGSLT